MKKVILSILDGVGYNENSYGNAFSVANTPNIDRLLEVFPSSFLGASGKDVGLPNGQMGNSEVGHLTIGSGRVVLMPLARINKAIIDKSFYKIQEFLDCFNHVKKNNSRLHIFGMLSDGGVHSHIDHIFELISLAKSKGVDKIYLHIFLDGRDTFYNVALSYLDRLSNYIVNFDGVYVATVMGRYYGMDREGMWDVTKLAYDAIVNGKGNKANSFSDMINSCYKDGVYDEFIPPFVFDKDGSVTDNDGIIVANFRPDRLTQLFWALTDSSFPHFMVNKLSNLFTVTMMGVDRRIKCVNAFPNILVNDTLGSVLEDNNCRSLRIAEDSKFPHVTHFFDGDRDIDYSNTDKIKIPRKNVATYDLYPAMSAYEVTDEIINIGCNYDFILVNYANGDMVGHTGNMNAAIEAMEVLDDCVGKLYDFAMRNDFVLVITADHGNVDCMLDSNGNMLTTHSLNPVYFIVCDKSKYSLSNGTLKDIAPTILDIMDIDKPDLMTGNSLIKD